ncbi:MAG TPA: hypothetical protein VFJ65_12610 [Solirubrobacterales bacterium]|nr:hypothetical protein [Solirubrobacterales bacterium]
MKPALTLLVCLLVLFASASVANADSWLPAEVLSAEAEDAALPQVAIDPQGNAIAVWQRFNGSKGVIQAAERPAGGSWSEPQDLSDPGESAGEADVAVDAAGNAIAVWRRLDGNNHTIVELSERPFGGAWSEPIELSAHDVYSYEPHVAVNARGDATVIWHAFGTGETLVQSTERPAGGSWSEPVDLSPSGKEGTEAKVGVDAAGTATAVWQLLDGGGAAIQTSRRPLGGTWSEPEYLSSSEFSAFVPDLAVTGGGDAAAVWGQFEGEPQRVRAAQLSGGKWSEAKTLSGTWADEPQVAVDGAGNAVVIWSRAVEETTLIESSEHAAGGSWTPPRILSGDGMGGYPVEGYVNVYSPRVAVNSQGEGVTVWVQAQAGKRVVESTFRSVLGAWSEPVRVSYAQAEQPALAISQSGSAVAAWRRDNGSNKVIEAVAVDHPGGKVTVSVRQAKRPGTKLLHATIKSGRGLASFRFKAIGEASGFDCSLVRKTKAKDRRLAQLQFGGCRSPRAYKHLQPGRYVFRVRAHGPGGDDRTPARMRFRIAG